MGAGYSRMNGVVVEQSSQGLAEYLLDQYPTGSNIGVVVGHDARHKSEMFARHAMAAFVRKGIQVWRFESHIHTPMVPFAVIHLKAAAGVMITASHNPARDNGYKVYGSNGCQIIPPADKQISDKISQNLKLPEKWEDPSTSQSNTIRESYRRAVCDCLRIQAGGFPAYPSFVYTPLHGVGLSFFQEVLRTYDECISSNYSNSTPEDIPRPKEVWVKEQAEPDPDFPTVKYPNPEEQGALDLAKKYADEEEIKLILANDPDADRFAAAEKVNGQWIQFTGDQMGILLACYLLESMKEPPSNRDVMLTTAVSSSMLSHIAKKEGFIVEETLTGFKWLGNRALELRHKENKNVRFAYEEALGYMFPSVVPDKDGIIAAFVFLNACSKWGSPNAKLHQIYQKYGYFKTMNTYWRSPDTKTTIRVFNEDIRQKYRPSETTLNIGSRKVTRWRDLSTGFDDGEDDQKAKLPSSPDTMMVTCWLEADEKVDGTRFTIRASGTEPKIKCELSQKI